jgi:hypothetical protein
MKNTTSSLSFLLIAGFFVFCLLNTETQIKITQKIEKALSLKEGTLSSGLDSTDGGGNTKLKKEHSQEVINYYNEIVMSSEFEGKRESAFKWNKDMKIFVEGEPSTLMISELNDVVSELNDIIDPIELTVVTNRSEANMFVYFGSSNGFANAHPNINRSHLESNWGLFKVTPEKGEMYVDIYRANELEQRHLLREELTQSLGLFNDTYDYPSSIFYQGWTTTTEYSDIDRELIDMLYNE